MDCRTQRPTRAIWLIGAILLGLAVTGCAYPRPGLPVQAAHHKIASAAGMGSQAHSKPSDTFMRSVASRDGALGWRQLCPELQRIVTEKAMRNQADNQKAAELGRIARLGIDFVGSRSLRSGSEIRVYVVTASMTDGSALSRVYIVNARQPSGCVADVQVEDER